MAAAVENQWTVDCRTVPGPIESNLPRHPVATGRRPQSRMRPVVGRGQLGDDRRRPQGVSDVLPGGLEGPRALKQERVRVDLLAHRYLATIKLGKAHNFRTSCLPDPYTWNIILWKQQACQMVPRRQCSLFPCGLSQQPAGPAPSPASRVRERHIMLGWAGLGSTWTEFQFESAVSRRLLTMIKSPVRLLLRIYSSTR